MLMSAHSRMIANTDHTRPPPRTREPLHARGEMPGSADYGLDVPLPIEVRRRVWSAFVRRALKLAKEDRGWSIPQVAERAKISNTTIYRWQDGNWREAPSADAIEAFCDALDIDPKHAFAVLWPGRAAGTPPPEPAPLDRDIELIARRLRDPNVSEADKIIIRGTLRHLLGREPQPAA